MGMEPEQNEGANGALTFLERVFYVIASVVMFALSGLIAPSHLEMQVFSRTEWELSQVAAVLFVTAFVVGLHGLKPPYTHSK